MVIATVARAWPMVRMNARVALVLACTQGLVFLGLALDVLPVPSPAPASQKGALWGWLSAPPLLQAIRMVQQSRRNCAHLQDLSRQRAIETGTTGDLLTTCLLLLPYTGDDLERATGAGCLIESLRACITSALPPQAAHQGKQGRTVSSRPAPDPPGQHQHHGPGQGVQHLPGARVREHPLQSPPGKRQTGKPSQAGAGRAEDENRL